MRSSLAPIVLFAYNRPIHTQKVLDALAQNREAKNSVLYIFCDGAKEDASDETIQKINETRTIVKLEKRFTKVIINENKENKGLANSIIDGVTEIVNRYGTIIVLEDDIIPSQGFLKYMNDAIKLYFNDPQVGCIHAWNWDIKNRNYHESTFFLKGADCWGWGTWKRAWAKFVPDGRKLLQTIESKNLVFEFNRSNTFNFVEMLKNQIDGKNDSWAIRWHASLFIKNMYCLYPIRPIVKNIGLDNSGFHCGELKLTQKPVNNIEICRIPINESDWFINSYSELLRKGDHLIKNLWQRLKTFLKHLFRQ
jgi:GT2 family glycosyltransferase